MYWPPLSMFSLPQMVVQAGYPLQKQYAGGHVMPSTRRTQEPCMKLTRFCCQASKPAPGSQWNLPLHVSVEVAVSGVLLYTVGRARHSSLHKMRQQIPYPSCRSWRFCAATDLDSLPGNRHHPSAACKWADGLPNSPLPSIPMVSTLHMPPQT